MAAPRGGASRQGLDPGPAESSPLGARVLRGLAVLAFVVAGACLLQSAAIAGKAWLGQRLLERAWQHTLAGHPPVRPWPWADTHPVARLRVPRLGIDEFVLSGATGRTLAWGPGALDGSAVAGEPGNAVYTGHRDTHFAFLEALRDGDLVEVERADRTRLGFRVDGARVVDAQALDAGTLAGDDRAGLLLVTCWPFDAVAPGTPWRYVVRASRVDSARPGTASSSARVQG